MDTRTMIKELERVEEKHKHDKVFTGQLNVVEMAHDIRKRLEELKSYEDIGITVKQIRELKKRNMPKSARPISEKSLYATCLNCRRIIFRGHRFCPDCGQRLRGEE